MGSATVLKKGRKSSRRARVSAHVDVASPAGFDTWKNRDVFPSIELALNAVDMRHGYTRRYRPGDTVVKTDNGVVMVGTTEIRLVNAITRKYGSHQVIITERNNRTNVVIKPF